MCILVLSLIEAQILMKSLAIFYRDELKCLKLSFQAELIFAVAKLAHRFTPGFYSLLWSRKRKGICFGQVNYFICQLDYDFASGSGHIIFAKSLSIR